MGRVAKAIAFMAVGFVIILVGAIFSNNTIEDYDAALTTANSTTNEMIGVVDVGGIFGIPMFYGFFIPGLACEFGAAFLIWKEATGGGGGGRRRR